MRASSSIPAPAAVPSAHRGELSPFYQVCWLGLLMVLINLLALIWNVFLGFGAWQAGAVSGLLLLVFLLFCRGTLRQQRRKADDRIARALAAERPRMKARLDALRGRLLNASGVGTAQLVQAPGAAVVASTTLNSKREPVVEMEAGFWATYSGQPALIEAALAHEAGHVAARDVVTFQRLATLMRILGAVLFPTAMVGALLLLGLRHKPLWAASLELGNILAAAVALALGWSALLIARELQADAFAVQVLGDRQPVEALLESQSRLRQAQPPRRGLVQRLWVWLIQPDLRWRSRLPVLDGRLGARIEVKLGIALAGFLVAAISFAGFMASPAGESYPVFALVLSGAALWSWWIVYQLIWGRSRAAGGRSLRALGRNAASVLRFALPELLLAVANLAISAFIVRPMLRGFEDYAQWSQAIALLFAGGAALAWSTAKLSLLSSKERKRDRPGVVRALLMLFVSVVAGYVFLRIMTSLLGASDLSPGAVPWDVLFGIPAASVVLGTLAHVLTPPRDVGEAPETVAIAGGEP